MALVILAVLLVPLLESLSSSARLESKAGEAVTALGLLRNLLNDAALLDEAKLRGAVEGAVPWADGWAYWVRAAPLTVPVGEGKIPVDVAEVMDLEICVHRENGPGGRKCVHVWW